MAAAPDVCVYLTGTITVVRGDRAVPEHALGGPQARLLIAILAREHPHRVSRHRLADELWGERLPPRWDVALRALVSKIRRALAPVADHRMPDRVITATDGCYQLDLATHLWVDTEHAHAAVHAAETHLANGRLDDAGADALVAAMISRRPLLTGIDGDWANAQRHALRDVRCRALQCLGEVWLAKGDSGQAVRDTQALLDLDPYNEAAYLRVMRAHHAAGNRAHALHVYERCRRVLADDLGTTPNSTIEALYDHLLGAAIDTPRLEQRPS